MASAACIKIAGVPVEFRVATILLAIMALFPIPVITTLPEALNKAFTAFSNSSFSTTDRDLIEASQKLHFNLP